MKVIGVYGPVGSGKTTLLKELKPRIPNSYVIPEYIDALPDAETKLKQYLDGTLAAFDFQQYVLDYFEQVANELKDATYDYVFVERLPVEGIQFFARLDLFKGRITTDEYYSLMNRARSLTFYPDPSLLLSDDIIPLKTDKGDTPEETAEVVLTHLRISKNIKLIKMTASFDTIKKRIHERGRECELLYYNDAYIERMIRDYL